MFSGADYLFISWRYRPITPLRNPHSQVTLTNSRGPYLLGGKSRQWSADLSCRLHLLSHHYHFVGVYHIYRLILYLWVTTLLLQATFTIFYIYISIFLYFYISIFLYFYISIFLYFYIYIFIYLYIYIFIYFYISIFLYFYISIFLYFYISILIYLYIYIFIYLYIYIFLYFYISIFLYFYISIFIY